MSDPTFAVPTDGSSAISSIPLTFGQILDRIFRLMRSYYKQFLGIGILPFSALFLYYAFFFVALYFAGFFKTPHPNPASVPWVVFPLGLLFLPIMLVLYGSFYGAISYASLQAAQGAHVSVGDAFRHAWGKLGRYIWLLLLRSLIVAIPVMVCGLAIVAGAALLGLTHAQTPSPAALFFLVPLAILLYLGALVCAVIVGLRVSLAFSACVGEDLTAWQAIRRSGLLAHGAMGRIFLVLLVVYAMGYVVLMIFYAMGLFVFAAGAVASMGHLQSASPLVILFMAGAGLLLAVIFLIWIAMMMASYSVALAVLYCDQCLRKDRPSPFPPVVPAALPNA